MQCEWLGERVAAPNLRMVVKNALTKQEAGNWGPNATFRFPTHGGTGGIWTAMADILPQEVFQLSEQGTVEDIHVGNKVVVLGDGSKIKYGNLISTMPLDHMLELVNGTIGELEVLDQMRTAAKQGLVYSSTIVLGLGIRGNRPDRIGDKCES